MKRPKANVDVLELGEDALDFSRQIVGEVAAIDAAGRASVFYPGNSVVPVRARSVVDAPARVGEHPDALVGVPVLLVFENGDPERPIIIGFVRDALRPAPLLPEVRLGLNEEREVIVDGERIVFDAQQEIVLRCGKSALVLRKDGKVLLRGADVLSRSSGPNRVKGASIKLN